MKKKMFFLLGVVLSFSGYSQSLFVRMGKNTTKFKFETINTSTELKSNIGDSYEVGVSFPLDSENTISYETALLFNNYNAYLGAPNSELNYSLNYLGIDNSLFYSILGTGRYSGRFVLRLKVGVNCNKMLSGTERIEGKIYELNEFPEFKGILFIGNIGIQTKYAASDVIDLSIGYNRGITLLNTGDIRNQSLSLSSNQIMVGIHFLIQ